MFQDTRQIFWYVIGGLFLLSAGLIALTGVTIPYALPIVLVLAGVIIIVAGVLGFRPTFPAFAVFLIGIVVFGLVASGPLGFKAYTTTETYELARTQAPAVEEIDLTCTVSTGGIKVTFTSNQSQLYKIVFTKYYSIFFQPVVNFTYSVNQQALTVNATSTAASVDIILSENLRSRLYIKTTTGGLQVQAPATATRVEKLVLTANTGEVQVDLANTERLREVVATTTTGGVDATIKSSFQIRDATVQLKTTTGGINLNLNITDVESDMQASTTTGNVDSDNIVGFTILSRTSKELHAQTPNYASSSFRKLDITATATTGGVNIIARHN